MPTPIKWKDKFQVNIGDAAIGAQSEPRIIGLKFPTSNFLVVWLESSTGTVGGGAGVNIICQRFSRDGGPVGDPEQVNSVSANLDEEDFDIAATNDGGFVVVYAVHDGNRSTIIWERHNSGNLVMETRTVVTENVAGEGFSNPQVTVNMLTDSSLVTFHRSVGGETDIRAVRINSDGVIGSEFDAADNSGNISGIGGDVAILANGNFVQVYRATDGGTSGVDARIFTSAGTEIATVDLTNLNTSAFVPPEVASLANGNWVATWKNTTGDLRAQVYSPTGVPVTGQLQISGGLSDFPAPQVTALQGGAFVVVWAVSGTGPALARCFNADGTFDGDVFEVAAEWTDLDVAAAPDGRILFTWRENGEIVASIWDPRASIISASDYVLNARNFVDSTIVMGRPTDTTILGNGIDGMWLEGQGGNDVLSGGANSQELRGGGGDDILDGGSGADDMVGGSGNDTFFVDVYSTDLDEGDEVSEFNGGGNDIVYASVSYALPFASTSIETLAAINQSGTTAINLTGNDIAQTIRGNNGVNVLRGEGGDDTLNGHGGGDQLIGGEGADTLDGGTAADTMAGGAGNDTMFVDHAGDVITELANEGFDVLAASLSYTLAAGVSIELMTTGWIEGLAVIHLAGNELGQQIWGNGAANIISGNGGDDTLFGFGGGDSLLGNAGADVLFGGAGAIDSLYGGTGDDTYFADDGGDAIVENAGEGRDVAAASVDYALGAGVSVELMTTGWIGGTATLNLTGNALGNEIWGNDGVNALSGAAGADALIGFGGNDRLDGGSGLDLMVGGTGQDSFAFTTALVAAEADLIADFSSADDNILLDDAIFTGLGLGALNPSAFVIGTAALDASDRILYDASTGKLYFDADGNGAGAAIQFATLSGNPALTASDFAVF